jgi:hypothetical protein
MKREHFYDVLSVPFVFGWMVTLYLLPMQLMLGCYNDSVVTVAIFVFSLTGMYFLWYRNLPPAEVDESTSQADSA